MEVEMKVSVKALGGVTIIYEAKVDLTSKQINDLVVSLKKAVDTISAKKDNSNEKPTLKAL